jgi:hypothetical protein
MFAITSAACSPAPVFYAPVDGAPPPDLAQPGGDAASPPDLSSALDFAQPFDFAQPSDFAQPPDFVAPFDLTQPPDLVTPPSGTWVLGDFSTTVPVPLPDAGVQLVPVRVLAPIATFGPATMHAYDDHMLFGCFADHYDLLTNPPPPDLDAGAITITGYAGGTLLNGQPAPSTIVCVLSGGHYQCGYGPPPGPDPLSQLFPSTATPILAGVPIEFRTLGGGVGGAFDFFATAADEVAVAQDLTMIHYDPALDTTLNLSCPNDANGACTFSVVIVQVLATSAPVGDPMYPGTSFGQLTCTGALGGNAPMIAIKAGAIAAMFAADPNLVQVQSRVLRVLVPTHQSDSRGYPVTVAAGRGTMGFSLP